MGLDLLSQYEIPYLHPLAVHFPLVLLLLGAAAAGIYLILGSSPWRIAALILVTLGAMTSWWAGSTGHDLEQAMEGDPMVEQVVHTHENLADWTLWTSLLSTFLLMLVTGIMRLLRPPVKAPEDVPVNANKPEPLVLRFLVAIPAGISAVLVAWTAHLGAIMVWGVPTG